MKKTDPDVLFLAEAFTRPAMMHALAQAGFTQSYTYFTWRTSKYELTEYGNDLAATAHYMRPNFFPTTPDILHAYLQEGAPAALTIRAVLASTLAPSYGIYSGYELFEHVALRAGSEEYLDTEKFQLRPRDLRRRRGRRLVAGSAAGPAQCRSAAPTRRCTGCATCAFTTSTTSRVIAYSKTRRRDRRHHPGGLLARPAQRARDHDVPGHARPRPGLGRHASPCPTSCAALTYTWGQSNYVRLTPDHPAHIFVVERSDH